MEARQLQNSGRSARHLLACGVEGMEQGPFPGLDFHRAHRLYTNQLWIVNDGTSESVHSAHGAYGVREALTHGAREALTHGVLAPPVKLVDGCASRRRFVEPALSSHVLGQPPRAVAAVDGRACVPLGDALRTGAPCARLPVSDHLLMRLEHVETDMHMDA